MSVHCPDCHVQVPPTARDGRCNQCRPPRRHSAPTRQRPRPKTRREREWDLAMARIITDHPTHREDLR